MSVPQLKMFESETEGGYTCDTKRDELVAPSCAICLSQSTNNLCALSCGHVFHHACVLAWFRSSKQSPKCPSCKKSVTSDKDIIKLYYSIEENNGSYFPTPQWVYLHKIGPQKHFLNMELRRSPLEKIIASQI